MLRVDQSTSLCPLCHKAEGAFHILRKYTLTSDCDTMNVLMISKSCVVGAYQKKLEEIARHDGIELTVVVPPEWRDERGTLTLERSHTTGYDMRVEPIAFNGRFHVHYYPTLGKIVRQVRPDVVHIDEEPYNLATFRAMWAAQRQGARTVVFAWQNLRRRYPPPFRWM